MLCKNIRFGVKMSTVNYAPKRIKTKKNIYLSPMFHRSYELIFFHENQREMHQHVKIYTSHARRNIFRAIHHERNVTENIKSIVSRFHLWFPAVGVRGLSQREFNRRLSKEK